MLLSVWAGAPNVAPDSPGADESGHYPRSCWIDRIVVEAPDERSLRRGVGWNCRGSRFASDPVLRPFTLRRWTDFITQQAQVDVDNVEGVKLF